MGSDGIDASDTTTVTGAWRRGLASAGALIVTVLLIALVVLVSVSNSDRDKALARERHSYDILVLTRSLDASMARSEAALGRFVISGDQHTGALYYDEWRRAGRMIDRLRELSAGNATQAPLVTELARLYKLRGAELAKPATRAYFKQGWPALSTFNDAGKSLTVPEIAGTMEQIAANERATLGARSDSAAASVQRSNFLAALLSGVGILLVLSATALGWATVSAMAQRRLARSDAAAEAERSQALEQAVIARTRQLREANALLREEAKERAAAEAQLRQVQKMEAVGQLTGGIAHDFNNMLAVVVGGLDLARRRLSQETPEVLRHIDNAMEGANRAAALTRRLLSFARAEPLSPKGTDPRALIEGMADLFDRTLGERIRIEHHIEPETGLVWCDPHQLENALLNLAVNARDAMEGEGLITIATGNVTLAEDQGEEVRAGDYVRIAVTDTGCGMTPEVRERVFEPFFTTKPVGKGTGLGLSQIFGFARQSGGNVEVASEPGRGTTVSLYLPRLAAALAAEAAEATAAAAPVQPINRHGTAILLVEDDPRVRASAVGALEELGYAPLACDDGEAALARLAEGADVGLVITDVVMPGMTGPELVARIAAMRPDLPVLYMTGYAGEAAGAEEFAGRAILRKPFTVTELQTAVAAVFTENERKARAA